MPNAYIATTDAVVNTSSGSAYLKKGITRAVEGSEVLELHPEFFKPSDEDAHFGRPETTRQEPEVPKTRTAKKAADKHDESDAKGSGKD